MASSAKRKPGRPKDESIAVRRRDEILEAAAKIFAQHGFPNTEMQYIADALQISKGSIYRYFPSKEHLFLAAVDCGMHRLHARVQSETASVTDPLDQIASAIQAYLAFFRDHPQYAELLIQERAEFKDRKQQTYFVHRDARSGPWRALLKGLIAEGRVRAVSVAGVIDVISDLVYGTMFTNYFAGRHKPLEAQADDVIDVVFFGILSEPERGRRRSG